jgi:hypothetical protein
VSLILRVVAAVVGLVTGAGALYSVTAGSGGAALLVTVSVALFYYASGRFGSGDDASTSSA